jgi:hypothetical protein
MGDAHRDAVRLTQHWAPGAALEIVEHPSEYSAAIYEAKNMISRLQDAIEALREAERRWHDQHAMKMMVEFDASCEAKKTRDANRISLQ